MPNVCLSLFCVLNITSYLRKEEEGVRGHGRKQQSRVGAPCGLTYVWNPVRCLVGKGGPERSCPCHCLPASLWAAKEGGALGQSREHSRFPGMWGYGQFALAALLPQLSQTSGDPRPCHSLQCPPTACSLSFLILYHKPSGWGGGDQPK